jgi:hypothetical protein
MRDALLGHRDPEIAEWAQTKGMADSERELYRIFDKTWKPGSIAIIGGVEKRLVTLEELNDRYALLEAPGEPSASTACRSRRTTSDAALQTKPC